MRLSQWPPHRRDDDGAVRHSRLLGDREGVEEVKSPGCIGGASCPFEMGCGRLHLQASFRCRSLLRVPYRQVTVNHTAHSRGPLSSRGTLGGRYPLQAYPAATQEPWKQRP